MARWLHEVRASKRERDMTEMELYLQEQLDILRKEVTELKNELHRHISQAR